MKHADESDPERVLFLGRPVPNVQRLWEGERREASLREQLKLATSSSRWMR